MRHPPSLADVLTSSLAADDWQWVVEPIDEVSLVDDVILLSDPEAASTSGPQTIAVLDEADTHVPVEALEHLAGIVLVGDGPERPSTQVWDPALPVLRVPGRHDARTVQTMLLRGLLALVRDESEPADRLAELTLEVLVTGDARQREEASETAAVLGWDLQRPRAVLLASIDPPVDPRTASSSLPTIAAAARATLGPDALVWTRTSMIAALLAPDDHSTTTRRALAEALRTELDTRVRAVTLSVGVGRSTSDPTALASSFVDATRAVDVGRWAKGRHVTELYDELGLERLLASAAADDLSEFVEHAIGPLLDHDRRQGTDLVETLSTWLAHRNIAASSRRMFVHYNTFKNRLDRIEQILGPVLDDASRLLECEVAIYVAQHYEGPWAPPSANTVHDET